MKLAIGLFVVLTVGLFINTKQPQISGREPVEVATNTSEVSEVSEAQTTSLSCPIFAPKCCAFVHGTCLECVGANDACP